MHPIKSALQPIVEQRIGRNLLRYQLVELRLKAFLPLRKIDFSDDGVADFKTRSGRVQTQMLGQLISGYLDSVEGTPCLDRKKMISEFLEARNWLTHHLLASHGTLQSDADCAACIEKLDRDYAAAEVVAAEVAMVTRLVIKMLRAFVDAWERVGANLSEGTDLLVAMEQHLTDETPFEVAVTMPPSVEDVLAVVMRRLHRERRDPEGWTHFSAAGEVLRRESPDLPKNGLLDTARKVDGFEFAQRPAGAPNAAWMYRQTC